MSDQGKRVVVVKRKVSIDLPNITEHFGRKARKKHARLAREEGKEYFSFCFVAERFHEFAGRCIAEGKKPNEVIWAMIEKDMGWTE